MDLEEWNVCRDQLGLAADGRLADRAPACADPTLALCGCGLELADAERTRQRAARQAWWQQVRRLIGLSRFTLGLSVRKTQTLRAFPYARAVSVGFIILRLFEEEVYETTVDV